MVENSLTPKEGDTAAVCVGGPVALELLEAGWNDFSKPIGYKELNARINTRVSFRSVSLLPMMHTFLWSLSLLFAIFSDWHSSTLHRYPLGVQMARALTQSTYMDVPEGTVNRLEKASCTGSEIPLSPRMTVLVCGIYNILDYLHVLGEDFPRMVSQETSECSSAFFLIRCGC